MKETKKAHPRRVKSSLFRKVFKGEGIDIGCGNDRLDERQWESIYHIDYFDVEHGDAQYITDYVNETYDFVYSSHCLEHMEDPYCAIYEWWELVCPGGYLIFSVPDEDLYEQGIFPSAFNPDHKWTFTISKKKSWSSSSLNVVDLIKVLSNCRIIKIELVDTNYDYGAERKDQSRKKNVETSIEVVLQKVTSNG